VGSIISVTWDTRTFLGSIAEEARAYGHPNTVEIVTAGHQIMLVSIHNADKF
jgi:hypothetical protein